MRVRAPKTGKEFLVEPADWGPHVDTGRVADLSPGLMDDLGIGTDDEVEIEFAAGAKTVVISSGHGLKIRGASGELDEVDEARRVVSTVAEILTENGCTVWEFHDDTSTTQEENLETIVEYHNSLERDLDISVHFNAYHETNDPMGTECLYLTQSTLAKEVASTIATEGDLIDRGPKQRTNLYFLKNTTAPAILIEVCFVDSSYDANAYRDNFVRICQGIADVIYPPSV